MDWSALRKSLIGERTESVIPPKIKIPMLPTAVLEFSRKAEDPNASPASLGAIIESDSGLTCELLRYVNSAAVGLRVRASSAKHAISMLGIRPAKLFLLSVGVQQAMKASKSKLINFQNFWAANLERALFAREIAVLLKANADLAYAASMLHDFLLPVISNELFATYLAYTELPETSRPLLTEYEHKQLGWDHCLATAQVMLNWGFPDDLVCCVLLHHSGVQLLADKELSRTAPAAVALAALAPDPLRQCPNGLEMLVKLESAWPQFKLLEMAQRVSDAYTAMSPEVGNHFSLLHHCEKLLAVAAPA